MQKGKLYRVNECWLYPRPTQELALTEIEGCLLTTVHVPDQSTIMFVEQHLRSPYTYKVVYGETIGWIEGNNLRFVEFKDHHAEPKEQA